MVEIQAIMNNFNQGTNKDKLVDYHAWVLSLRMPLTGRRKAVVCDALAKINPKCADGFTVGQARASFMFE